MKRKMGIAPQPPPEVDAPQPIPPESIREFYVEQLEIRMDLADMEKLKEEAVRRMSALQARFAKLFTDAGLTQAEWNVNLKTGRLWPADKASETS